MRRLRDESGQVAPIVAVSIVGLLAIAGLVIDGGLMFSARRDLQALSDGAARAGAMAVDELILRESNDAVVQLDPDVAEEAAFAYLAAANFDGDAEVFADSDQVEVRLRRARNTTMLAIVGISEFEVSAVATAVLRTEPR